MEQEAGEDDWMGINRNCWPGGGDRLLSNSIASSRCSLVLFSSRPACPYHFVFGEQHQWPHSSQTRLQLITNQREMESVGEDFSALLLSIYIKRNQPTPSGVSPLCYVGGRPRFNLLDSCHHTIICSRREGGRGWAHIGFGQIKNCANTIPGRTQFHGFLQTPIRAKGQSFALAVIGTSIASACDSNATPRLLNQSFLIADLCEWEGGLR